MSDGAQIGTRIRERRMDQGVRQAELAAQVGISPSYLNLIEHNRRRIAGGLLGDIAAVLNVDADLLSAGVDQQTLDKMNAAAAGFSAVAAELSRGAEMAARYPGWAAVIAGLADRATELEAQTQEMSDRLTFDPNLATSLHSVITAVTSIRSTASILTGDDMLDPDWLRRFHTNIYNDAIRLADQSDALIKYLEAPDHRPVTATPLQEVEDYLVDTGHHRPQLETGDRSAAEEARAAKLSPAATDILTTYCERYLRDCSELPRATLEAALERDGIDPPRLCHKLGAPLSTLLRRIAMLPDSANRPSVGLIEVDGAGVQLLSKPLAGVAVPRSGACPLWPVFTALGQPGRPVSTQVSLHGAPEIRLACYAVCDQTGGEWGTPPLVRATMLMVGDPPEAPGAVVPVGPTCRICTRADCAARREPTVLQPLP